ncbi:MAG: T9SS type A sorting domain-containing protein, partial [Cytophagales bacterium]|nr:T9SS type A sorting domain-containing protein [Cytophagales bacterium]
GDVVKAQMSIGGSGTSCIIGSPATSNGINIYVNPIKSVSVTVAASATSICSGTGVTFTSTGIYAGSSPTMAWLVNGNKVSTGNVFGYVPSNNDIVMAILTVGGNGIQCVDVEQATSSGISIQTIPLNQSPCLLPQIDSISGPSNIVSGSSGIVFSVPSGSATNYQWTVPAGATIVSGQGTNSIVVNFGSSVGGSIGLVATNANGSASISKSIQIGALPVIGSISGPVNVSTGQSGVVYSVGTALGTNYQWVLPNGATLVSGQGTGTIVVDFTSTVSGFLSVVASNSFGTSSDSLQIQTSAVTSIGSSSYPEFITSLYPNPYSTSATLSINSTKNSVVSISLFDMNGHLISSWNELTVPLKLEIGEGLPAGMYTLAVKYEGLHQFLKLVKVK